MARENGMKVLVAGDDELSRRMLDALLTEAGYQVVLAQGGQEALAVAVGQDPPRILLLDWGMPGLDGIEVCRRVRRRGGAARPYILLISEKPRRQDALDGLDAGADDFITKPYAPEELLARVRVAERVIGATTASSGLVLQALSEALESPGGEVMVRSGEAVGRIFVHEGRVAWAHVSTEPISLYELLEPDAGVTSDDLRGVIEECKRTRRNFGEVLVAWGLVDRARLRERLCRWISRKLDAILHLPHPSVLFVPQAREYASDLTFALEEVLLQDAMPRSEQIPVMEAVFTDAPASVRAWSNAAPQAPPALLTELQRRLGEALRIEGARSAALLESETGRCLAQRGEPVNLDLAFEQLRLARALGPDESAEEILISSSTSFHLMRTFAESPRHFLYAAIRRSETTLAMVRLQLAAIAGQRLP